MFRSFLFVPANIEKYYLKASATNTDVIIVDFEDSVQEVNFEKSIVTFNKMKGFLNKHLLVRYPLSQIHTISDKLDLSLIDGILVPKIDFSQIELLKHLKKNTKEVYGLVETPAMLFNLFKLLEVVKLDGIFFGSEDYLANLNITRSQENLDFARKMIVNACASYGISCYDTIFPETTNSSEFKEEVKLAKLLGFTGKMAIHPSQIDFINESFSLTETEISHMNLVIKEFDKIQKKGLNVLTIDNKIYELPHINSMRIILEKYKK